jgi:L-rhamnose 1-dehydrogenase
LGREGDEMMRLRDKVAIVTGGSRGIGRAIALGLAREGAKVVINYCNNKGAAEEVVGLIREKGGTAIAVKADTSCSQEVLGMVRETLETFQTIDILVNNAGICIFKDFLEITEEEWDKVLAVNLKGYFLCSQAVARVMVERGIKGKIICISSISSIVGGSKQAHYCASKAGINLLTKSMAIALGPYGITCNAILPGTIETDINREELADPKRRDYLVERVPLKRLGLPEDVVGAVIFLASEEAAWITGSTLVIDGGTIVNY